MAGYWARRDPRWLLGVAATFLVFVSMMMMPLPEAVAIVVGTGLEIAFVALLVLYFARGRKTSGTQEVPMGDWRHAFRFPRGEHLAVTVVTLAAAAGLQFIFFDSQEGGGAALFIVPFLLFAVAGYIAPAKKTAALLTFLAIVALVVYTVVEGRRQETGCVTHCDEYLFAAFVWTALGAIALLGLLLGASISIWVRRKAGPAPGAAPKP